MFNPDAMVTTLHYISSYPIDTISMVSINVAFQIQLII